MRASVMLLVAVGVLVGCGPIPVCGSLSGCGSTDAGVADAGVTCSRPSGTFTESATRETVYSGDAGSTWCPVSYTTSTDFVSGSMAAMGTSPATGAPISVTSTYDSGDCHVTIKGESIGCTGSGNVCRSLKATYDLQLSPDGKSLTGTQLLTLVSGGGIGKPDDSCQARYNVSFESK